VKPGEAHESDTSRARRDRRQWLPPCAPPIWRSLPTRPRPSSAHGHDRRRLLSDHGLHASHPRGKSVFSMSSATVGGKLTFMTMYWADDRRNTATDADPAGGPQTAAVHVGPQFRPHGGRLAKRPRWSPDRCLRCFLARQKCGQQLISFARHFQMDRSSRFFPDASNRRVPAPRGGERRSFR
jgi:hypothetical protein